MQHLKFAFALVASLGFMGTTAYARPNVQLHLVAEAVGHDASGAKTLDPIAAGEALKPGEIVHYDIIASNAGSEPALKLAPVGRIPAGMAYEAGSASTAAAFVVEFSLDGGKTWSKAPTVKVSTSSGVVEKKADPATYTTVRWIMQKPLAPKASVTYSYEVRVK
jgi:uncharacterized repeat protein (TIGR01451 family)